MTVQGLAATRRTLLQGLKNWDNQESWRRFFDTYWRLLLCVAMKSGLTEQEAQDAVQETIISVAKTMPTFKYDPSRCSFKTWLWHLLQKRIADQFRKRPPATGFAGSHSLGTSTSTATEERVIDPASLDLDEI